MQSRSVWTSTRNVDLYLLLAAAVFIYLLLFKLPFYPFYQESDQLIFLYNADRMMHGEYMYRDFFQFTFPGGQALYFLLFSIFGINFWVLPFATLLMGVASFWVLLRASKLVVNGPYAYIAPILFIFFGFRWFGLDGSHRTFSPLFILIAVWILLKGRSLWHYAAAGSFAALASFFTQQRGLVALASFCVFIVVDNFYRSWKWKRVFTETAVLVGSFAISIAAMCSYFLVTAGFDVFINSTLLYPSRYYKFHAENNYGVFFLYLENAFNVSGIGPILAIFPSLFYSFAIPLSVLIFVLVFWRKRIEHDWDLWRGPMLMFLVTAFAVISTTNPNYLRYYNLSATSLILIAWLLEYFNVFGKRRTLAVIGFSWILLIFAAFQAYRVQTNWEYLEINAPRGRVYSANIDRMHRYIWLQEHTKPGDPVFEAFDPFVYFLLELRNPSRFTQIYPTEYTRPEFVTGTVDDLRADPPLYILWDNTYNKSDNERLAGDHTGPLADYVQKEYEPVGPIYEIDNKPMQIWERRQIQP